jgi:hypothetical protein
MELKHLTQRFVYKIEPKPEGGFIARPTDPTAPALEAPTREELQQKIQAKMVAALGEVFPGLNLPVRSRGANFDVHVERKPGGGFTVHSSQQGSPTIEPATQEKVDHFAEELLDFVDKHFPDLSAALAAQAGGKDINVFTRVDASVTRKPPAQPGSAPGLAQGLLAEPNSLLTGDVKLGDAKTLNGTFANVGDTGNNPITPESSSSWPVLRFLLALLIAAAAVYFFLHHR